MTEAVVKEGRPYHCGQMSRMLRHEHRDLLLKMHVPVHRDLSAVYGNSSWTRAFFLDGELTALGGVTGPAIGLGRCTVAGPVADRPSHWGHVARETLRQIESLMEIKSHLVTVVLKEDMPAIRFAYFVGFGGAEAVEINGTKALKLSLTRKTFRGAH